MPQQCFVNSNEGLIVNPKTTFILTGLCEANCYGEFEFDWAIKFVSENGQLETMDATFYTSKTLCS